MYHLSHEKKNLRYATGLKVNPNDWDFKRKNIKQKKGNALTPQLRIVTKKLNQIEVTMNDILGEYQLNEKRISSAELKYELDVRIKGREKIHMTFFDCFRKMVSQMEIGGSAKGTIKQYNKIINILNDYQDHTKNLVSFDRMDMDFYYSFLNYCRNVRDNHDNNIGRNVGRIKTFMRWSKKEGYHDNEKFLEFKELKYETDDIALTEEEVNALEELELEGLLDLTRDLFLIGVYSGQRYSDYSVFEKADIKDNMIVKRAKKTHQASYIPIHGKLMKLLEKYDFNLPEMKMQKFNNRIKEVCRLAGMTEETKKIMIKGSDKVPMYIPKHNRISSHTARRTFITRALSKGIPRKIVMTITGITDEKTLNNYYKVNEDMVSNIMMDFWD